MCLPGDLHRQRLGLQAIAVAGLAGHVEKYFSRSSRAQSLSVSFQRRSRLVITPSNGFFVVVGAQAVVIDELDLVLAGAVEDRVRAFFGRPSHGR
jgi:hypothetical protein